MQASTNDVDVDLRSLWVALLARWRRILVVALLAALAAVVFVMLATPQYRAATRVLIETRESVYTRPGTLAEQERPILDEEGVTSQVELISSSDILRDVARQLELSRSDEFNSPGNAVTRVLSLVGLRRDPSSATIEDRVVNEMRQRLQVYRVERSRVIVIEFSSRDPALAAAVPNAIADAYLAIQREAKLVSNADATQWLEPEIEDLRARVREAETRVADFRSRSDLLVGQNNATLAAQQLSEVSTELSRVRSERAAAVARAEEVRAALSGGRAVEAIPEVLSSPLVQRLIERRVQLNSEIADLSTTYMDNHPRMRAQRSQLADLDRQIRSEVAKVLSALEGEAQSAQRREQELNAELNRLKVASARAGEEEVELRALEREATAQRELLESYLTRYREASSRLDRNYLPVDARVFSRATPPSESYFPKPIPIVGAAFAGTLLLMAIATLLAELFSGRALQPAPGRRVDPVRDVVMPANAHISTVEVKETVVDTQAAAETIEVAPVPAAETAASAAEGVGLTVQAAADAIISAAAARAVFVSPEGDEAVAASVMVAREVSDAGLRVIFLDLTQSGAATMAMLEDPDYRGITDLLSARAQFADVIHGDLYSDCHVIPIGTADMSKAMRAIERLPIIMSSLATAYDLVVVECGSADADGVRRVVDEDSLVFVAAIEPEDDAVSAASLELSEKGFDRVAIVVPTGSLPASSPGGRRAA